LEDKKNSLEDLRKQKVEDAILRSKLEWMEFGEKPSKFFLNLEKQNRINRQIKTLIDDQGNIILNENVPFEIHRFYSKLYKHKPVSDFDWDILKLRTIPKLNAQMKDSLEGPLLIDEISQVIKNMKNNKSPGMDGFTVEFLKFFWENIKYFLLRSLNYAYFNGHMTEALKMGVITLLPKGNKDRKLLSNWRPISLLNIIYKIASSCIEIDPSKYYLF